MKKIYLSALLGFIHFFLSAQTEFITTWKTDNSGTSADNQITIPTFPGEVYDYFVDWGDGSSDSNVTGDITHTYAGPGTYTVSITGDFPRIYFNYDGFPENIKDKDKILLVNQWGTGQWNSMENAFNGCTNIDVVATDTPNLSNVTSVAGMFYLCSSLVGNAQFNNWNTENVSNFLAMFRGASQFNQFIGSWNMSSAQTLVSMFQEAIVFNQDIGAWNIGKVSNLGAMFQEAHAFNQNINGWNTANVTNMSVLFNGALSFNQPLNNWDVGKVLNMQGMFANSSFNQDIGSWNVGNVTNMSEMFANIFAFNQDISGWDVSNVTEMFSMFEGVMDFDQNLGGWDVSKVTNMERMFAGGAISPDNYDSTLIGWYQLPGLQENVVFDGGESHYCNSVVERLKLMYEKNWTITDQGRSSSFCTDRPFITTWKTDNPGLSEDNAITIPISGGPYTIDWGDGNIETDMFGSISHTYSASGEYMVSIAADAISVQFNSYPGNEANSDASKLLEINQWGDVRWTNMGSAYAGCVNMDVVAEDVPHLSGVTSLFSMFVFCSGLKGNQAFNAWDVSGFDNLTQVFSGCTQFKADVSKWDVVNVTEMSNLFNNCINFNQDISAWNVGNVTNMAGIFSGATNFNQDIGGWDVSSVTNMSIMFQSSGFNRDISNWNVGNVTNMRFMFNQAPNFNQNIGGWNVSKVTDMTNMLSGTGAFDQDIGNWDVSSVVTMKRMFTGAMTFNQDISGWNVSNVTEMDLIFSYTNLFNQNLSTWDVTKVTNMAGMFEKANAFNGNISNWNVLNVENMENMFNGASSFDQDLGDWNVSNVRDMANMFFDAGLSIANYDSLLKGWSNLPSLQNNVVFDAGNSEYCASGVERQSIIDTYGWTITDAGPNTSCHFITTWKTDNLGITEDNQISIPTYPGLVYDYEVIWGDGTSDSNVTGDITHTYPEKGTYQVSIVGEFPRIYFNAQYSSTDNDSDKIIMVNQWGDIRWKDFSRAFKGCEELDVIALDSPNMEDVSRAEEMFAFCSNMVGNTSFGNWDVSGLIYATSMFSGCLLFNQDIGEWNVSNMLRMNNFFSSAETFNQDISGWDLSNVESLQGMFNGARAFNQDLSGWDFPKVTNLSTMFQQASAFNKDISGWDVSRITDFTAMFNGAESFNQPIGVWDMSSAVELAAMFQGANSFTYDITAWNLSNAKNMAIMFAYNNMFNQNISNWNVSNVTNMGGLFWNNTVFNRDLSGWNTSNVMTMERMFEGAISFDMNLGGWDVSKVESMTNMFENSGMSTENYDKTLIGWNSLSSLQNNVDFEAGSSQYCESAEARQLIIDTYGWIITDAGEHPLCNQDNDADGVPDHEDNCLESQPGVEVDANGCDIIPNDAIKVFVLTPSCIGSSDGAIEISMNLSGYLLDISISGEGLSNQFDDISSEIGLKINDLSAGNYTITVSIPEIFFEQTYGVTVNELDSVTGKRTVLNASEGTVTYTVEGSKLYEVLVNGKIRSYTFEDSGPQTISINNLKGQTEVSISGESDCQGKISDNFFIGNGIQVYPTITTSQVGFFTEDTQLKVKVFSLDGRLVKELNYNQYEKNMDVSYLESGIYVLQMERGVHTETIKIIKK
ncbi:BspA family leucine-rich repeat surface protein [Flagellimonas sp. 2504JD1-5]